MSEERERLIPVPWERLSQPALEGLVEEVVTRDGTDYGEVESPLELKKAQILDQLRRGELMIVFDPTTEGCNVVRRSDFQSEPA